MILYSNERESLIVFSYLIINKLHDAANWVSREQATAPPPEAPRRWRWFSVPTAGQPTRVNRAWRTPAYLLYGIFFRLWAISWHSGILISFIPRRFNSFNTLCRAISMKNGSGCNDLSGYAPSAYIKLRKIKAILWLPVSGSVNSFLLIRSAIWSSCGCWLCMPLLLFIASCRIYIYIIAFCPEMSIPVLVF